MSDKNVVSVTVDGKIYTIDVNRAKELGILKKQVPRVVGYEYKNTSGRTYMLTRFLVEVPNAPTLTYVSLVSDGHPWSTGVLVKNYNNISDDEWERITASSVFGLVTKV